MKTIFNQDTLIAIKIVDRKLDTDLRYEFGSEKTFWNKEVPAGFSLYHGADYKVSDRVYSIEELESGKWYGGSEMIVEKTPAGYWAFYHPYVKLFYMGDWSTTETFDTYEEALARGTELAKSIDKQHIVETK